MLILNKQIALERMVSLAEQLHEAVPEPFSALAATSFMGMPVVPATFPERRLPLLTATPRASKRQNVAAPAR